MSRRGVDPAPRTRWQAWVLAASLGSMPLGGCASEFGRAQMDPYDGPGILVRNRSREILCEAFIDRPGERTALDALEPTEVIGPGGSRFFELPEGAHDVRIADCNGDIVLTREGVQVGPQGVMLSFEERH